MAERILMNEFKALTQEPWVNLELKNDDIFNWTIGLIVLNPDSLFYGGYFQAAMKFPSNYPYSPPEFRFLRALYHPNIYTDGKLCISILHSPGEDEMSGELASERWSPAQRVESVLISILSLLDDAEVSSPANVDAGVLLRKDPEAYKDKVRKCVEDSKADIPEGFEMPTHESTSRGVKSVQDNDSDFWADSDADDDVFGGSGSDQEDLDSDAFEQGDESGSDEE
ncbi:ubiquitin-conjugating enzyme/RWD-like protein [Aspergillus aurantiobrunneus]